jgi:hypothetical protein
MLNVAVFIFSFFILTLALADEAEWSRCKTDDDCTSQMGCDWQPVNKKYWDDLQKLNETNTCEGTGLPYEEPEVGCINGYCVITKEKPVNLEEYWGVTK